MFSPTTRPYEAIPEIAVMIMIDEASNEVPEVFLLVENTRKGSNFGPFLRCASAFGIRTIVVVGYDRVSAEGNIRNREFARIPYGLGTRYIELFL